MFYFDPTYFIIVGPAILLALWAQFKVNAAFAKWSEVRNLRGLTGRQAAEIVLREAGVQGVRVEETEGMLSDHYDPRDKVLRLSPSVFSGTSVASMGVAAHEAGHAIQHAAGYAALRARNAIVPLASIGSWLAWPMIFAGLLLHFTQLALAGFVAFLVLVVFQVLTLPVEFDASRRARLELDRVGLLTAPEEAEGVKKVLDAAALTYVAATIAAVAQLFYFALRLGLLGGRRSND
jgi:Zn-dependent membrane protease YugP